MILQDRSLRSVGIAVVPGITGAALRVLTLAHLFPIHPLSRTRKYFKRQYHPSPIEDDHTPFLERGVPILHVIPWPFPKVVPGMPPMVECLPCVRLCGPTAQGPGRGGGHDGPVLGCFCNINRPEGATGSSSRGCLPPNSCLAR